MGLVFWSHIPVYNQIQFYLRTVRVALKIIHLKQVWISFIRRFICIVMTIYRTFDNENKNMMEKARKDCLKSIEINLEDKIVCSWQYLFVYFYFFCCLKTSINDNRRIEYQMFIKKAFSHESSGALVLIVHNLLDCVGQFISKCIHRKSTSFWVRKNWFINENNIVEKIVIFVVINNFQVAIIH